MDEKQKRAKCELSEEEWIKEQREFCDSRYANGEMNRYCQSVVDREAKRREQICKKAAKKSDTKKSDKKTA
jgi:hypothetical protein